MIFADRVLEDEVIPHARGDDAKASRTLCRPEFENPDMKDAVVGDIERRLTVWERISNMDPVRNSRSLFSWLSPGNSIRSTATSIR